MSAWSHLPNAAHIDRILADLQANPGKWNMAGGMAHGAEWGAARDAAQDAANDAARVAAYDEAWDAAQDMTRSMAWIAVCGAILALIAYDDCAYLLNTKPEHVKTIALLGVPAAGLLYPAVVALNNLTENTESVIL